MIYVKQENKVIKFDGLDKKTYVLKSSNTEYPLISSEFDMENMFPGVYTLRTIEDGKFNLVKNFEIVDSMVMESTFTNFDKTVMDTYIHIYVSIHGNLVVAVTKNLMSNIKIDFINKTELDDKTIINYNHHITNKNETIKGFYLIERNTKQELKIDHDLTSLSIKYETMTVGLYDFFIKIDIDGFEVVKKVFVIPFRQQYKLVSFEKIFDDIVKFGYFYRTFKGRYLVLKFDHASKDIISHYENTESSLSNVILIGEQPIRANDNGFALFEHVRLNHPEYPIYYVIDRESDSLDKVKKLGNYVIFGSEEHFLKFKEARYIACSHHPNYLLPIDHPFFTKELKKKYVTFLQHGVMGTKYMANLYGNHIKEFNVDNFVVSSQREFDMIVKDFGYPKSRVKVTGLARYDKLLANDIDVVDNKILIMPTWRDYLNSSTVENFVRSTYNYNWTGLINQVKNAFPDHEIDLYLHVNMQKFIDYMDLDGVNILQDTSKVQEYMKESKVLITDYSSVGFDFSFLKKQVIYYQFDPNSFYGKFGSHLDIENELPGFISQEQDEIIGFLKEHFESGCVVQQEYLDRSNIFLKRDDKLYCEKNFEAVIGCNSKKLNLYKFKDVTRRIKLIPKFILKR